MRQNQTMESVYLESMETGQTGQGIERIPVTGFEQVVFAEPSKARNRSNKKNKTAALT